MTATVRRIKKAKDYAREVACGDLITTPGSLPDMHVTYDSHEEEGDRWRLTKTYEYPVQNHAWPYGKTTVVVPAGTTSDLASIPDILWPIIAPFELSLPAPWMHDMLYRHGGLLPESWLVHTWGDSGIYNEESWFSRRRSHVWTREEADKTFKEDMERQDISEFNEWAAYLAVRTFGWISAWQDPAAA